MAGLAEEMAAVVTVEEMAVGTEVVVAGSDKESSEAAVVSAEAILEAVEMAEGMVVRVELLAVRADLVEVVKVEATVVMMVEGMAD